MSSDTNWTLLDSMYYSYGFYAEIAVSDFISRQFRSNLNYFFEITYALRNLTNKNPRHKATTHKKSSLAPHKTAKK